MQVDFLGVCAAYPAQADACSGYLVTAGDTRLLVDCGPGVMGNLPHVCSYFDLTAILISHLHVDHYLDLYPMRYALMYSIHRPENYQRIPLIMPSGEYSRMFSGSLEQDRDKFDLIFSAEDMGGSRIFDNGKLAVDFALMKHPLKSYASRITDAEGIKLVYSGDTAYNETLIEFAEGADLLLCEATLQEKYSERTNSGHLTAAEAGEIAQAANVKKLVLTHIWPEFDRKFSVQEAAQNYSGPIEIAETGSQITVR